MRLAFDCKRQTHHLLSWSGTSLERLQSPNTLVMHEVPACAEDVLHGDISNRNSFSSNRERPGKNVPDELLFSAMGSDL